MRAQNDFQLLSYIFDLIISPAVTMSVTSALIGCVPPKLTMAALFAGTLFLIWS